MFSFSASAPFGGHSPDHRSLPFANYFLHTRVTLRFFSEPTYVQSPHVDSERRQNALFFFGQELNLTQNFEELHLKHHNYIGVFNRRMRGRKDYQSAVNARLLL